MRNTETGRQKTVKRRSSRLAGGSNEPLQYLPVAQKKTSTQQKHSSSATIAPSSIVVALEIGMSSRQLSDSDRTDSNHPYASDMASVNKENMVTYHTQLYDRIKRNPRKATKKTQSNALQARPNSDNHQAPAQQWTISMPALQFELDPLYMPGHAAPRDVSELPTPAPTSTDSDLTYQRTMPGIEASELPSTPASLIPSEDQALEVERPTRASKREAEANPGCDSQPHAKRSRSVLSQLGQELEDDALKNIASPPSVSIEARETHLYQPASGVSLGATQALRNGQANPARSCGSVDSDEMPVLTPALSDSSNRAVQDMAFIENMRKSLLTQSKRKAASVGKRQARRILGLLERAKSPDGTEALFVSADEAKAQLQANQYFSGPIITEGQQPLALQTIQGFLSEQYDDDAKVCIQDPSVKLTARIPHTREITIGMLKEHFQNGEATVPYNCLELAAHVEDGLRPAFLNTKDCRLLTKLKHPSSKDQVSRRSYEPGWKEVEKWALLAKAGALTEPHQDSHGYSTYITVNQGTMGFGWLSNPTDEQRAAWRKDPVKFIDGQWRYVVLRPGQTVYFPAGTVHFVFRLTSEGDTLAFGGHVLRCSHIVRWIKTLLEERETKSQITNEDLSVSAPEYLERVEKFVVQARKTGQQEKWGGEEAIAQFLKLKAEFLAGDEVGA